jgi:LEA14-like dessication related protein
MNNFSSTGTFVSSSLLLVGLVCAACATVPPGIEPPKISIANIEPKDVTLFEQRFDVQLRIRNPNEEELTISGVRFEIDLNEREFAYGMSGERVVVPRFGSQVVAAEMITGLSRLLRQFQELQKAGQSGKYRYRIKGTAFVDGPGVFRLPFDEKDEIELGFAEEPAVQ